MVLEYFGSSPGKFKICHTVNKLQKYTPQKEHLILKIDLNKPMTLFSASDDLFANRLVKKGLIELLQSKGKFYYALRHM